jgi:hypothetical protein
MAPVSEPWASGLFQLRRPSGGVDCAVGYATLTRDALGFDPSVARGGFGMRESIEWRMRDAGGTARVVSAPGAGTRITLSRPG